MVVHILGDDVIRVCCERKQCNTQHVPLCLSHRAHLLRAFLQLSSKSTSTFIHDVPYLYINFIESDATYF